MPEHLGRPQGSVTFATTRWSVVVQAGGVADSAEVTTAFGILYQTYWYPLYAFVRREGHGPEAAEDLVQEVFLALLEKRQLTAVSPARGRFRSYLLAAAQHLLANEWHKQRRLKRGAGLAPVALDGLSAEERYRLEPVDQRTPESLYARRWAMALLAGVLERLRREWEAADKGATFDVLRVFLAEEPEKTAYAEAAKKLGQDEGAIRVAVHRLRRKYRDLLRQEIAQTVDTTTEIDDEWRYLLQALRG